MRRVMVTVVVCALVLVICSASASAKPAARPFKGFVSGEVTFVPDGTSPTGLRTVSSAVGNASHLGLTVMTSHHPTPSGEQITGGEMILLAANRDQVWIDYTGSAPFPVPGVTKVVVVDVDFTIVGGTGRFSDASGRGDMTAYVQFPGFEVPVWPATWTWRGSIRY